jgi:hypothetical protein
VPGCEFGGDGHGFYGNTMGKVCAGS